MKGRKRKEQEMSIDVCEIHVIWWAQDMVLFSFFLKVKIPNNQEIFNTSVTCPPFPDLPKSGF